MSILWVQAEQLSFPIGCGYINLSSNDWVRAVYNSGVTNTWKLANTTFTPQTSLWLRYYFYGTVSAGYYHAGLFDSSSGYGIYTSCSATNKIEVCKWQGSETQIAQESGTSFVSSSWCDIQIVNYGASGTVRVFVNNVKLIDYTGDITLSGVTGFDCVGISGREGSTSDIGFGGMVVADESTRNMYVKTLAPNAAGDATDWSGTYGDIDENHVDDGDSVYTNSVGQDAQYNTTGWPAVGGNFTVRALCVAARMSKGDYNLDAKIGIKTNSAVYLGSPLGLVDAYNHYEYFVENNPATASPFIESEINALQLAVSSIGVSSTTTTTTT